MANQWFKFYGSEYLLDPKIRSLTTSQRQCWTVLMCHSNASECEGLIKYMTEEQLLLDAGIKPSTPEWDATLGVLEIFKEKHMITISDDGMITLVNWSKKQGRMLTPYERTKRYRIHNKDKIAARAAVKRALENNVLKQEVCEVCGENSTEAHHDSYEKEEWLNVRWLCKKHHEISHHDDTDYADDDARVEEKRVEKKRIEKNIYGEFRKVKLSEEEKNKLDERLGEKNTNLLIAQLDGYIESKGKKYKSHYATILNWATRKALEHHEKAFLKTKKFVV